MRTRQWYTIQFILFLFFFVPANGAWHRSKAYDSLKNDIRTVKLDGKKKTKEVYNTRVEYQVYPLKKFRNQIYHEHTRIEKIKSIKEGRHPRFSRLRLNYQWDPLKEKVKSSDVYTKTK